MDRRKRASGISGGIFLVGIGILLWTGWWWPGIMLVIGLSGGAEQIFRGNVARGIGTIAFFTAIPLVITLVQSTDISWGIVAPFFLIVLGVILLVKTLYLDDRVKEKEPEQETLYQAGGIQEKEPDPETVDNSNW